MWVVGWRLSLYFYTTSFIDSQDYVESHALSPPSPILDRLVLTFTHCFTLSIPNTEGNSHKSGYNWVKKRVEEWKVDFKEYWQRCFSLLFIGSAKFYWKKHLGNRAKLIAK